MRTFFAFLLMTGPAFASDQGHSLGGVGLQNGARDADASGGYSESTQDGGGEALEGFDTKKTKTAKDDGCPAPAANVVIRRSGPPGSNQFLNDEARTDGLPPTIYAFRLPTINGKHSPTGYVTFAPNTVASGPPTRVEVSLSKCPGDYATPKRYSYTATQWTSPGKPAPTFNPCYGGSFFADMGGGTMAWAPEARYDACPIPENETWYVNMRLTDPDGKYMCPRNRKWKCGTLFGFQGHEWERDGDHFKFNAAHPEDDDRTNPNNVVLERMSGWDGKCEITPEDPSYQTVCPGGVRR